MLFHTWTFAVFLAVVLTVHLLVRRTRFGNLWLLVASYIFYGWWHPYYLGLILFSTLVDYVAVRMMERRSANPSATGWWGSRHCWLIVSIVNNLGTLAFFKYARFAVDNLNIVLGYLPVNIQISSPEDWMPFGWEYLLPVGISFYTFQSMSYTIDYYRGHIKAENNFIRFATYVSFFPQLVAGPIERATRLLPQFSAVRSISRSDVSSGGWLILVGLFKKLALANYIALYVEQVFGFPEDHSTADLALASFAFAWQIYFDFSGYSDIARGIARWMGFELCLNFNHPYVASSLSQFWQRWHISLSTWFRDYIYIPMGGNRVSSWRLYGNLLITFVISGIWHGANWTFVVWGLWHGLGLCLARLIRSRLDVRIPAFIGGPVVFIFVWIGWIFFRADDMSQAMYILGRIGSGGWGTCHMPMLMIILIALVWIYQMAAEYSQGRRFLQDIRVQAVLAVAMLIYLFFGSASGGAFIYFQF